VKLQFFDADKAEQPAHKPDRKTPQPTQTSEPLPPNLTAAFTCPAAVP